MNRNTSEAYDFDRFAAQETKQPNNVVELPVKKQKHAPKQKRSFAGLFKGLGVCAVCVVLFGSLVYNEMSINELNTNIQQSNKQLNQVQNEYIQLEMAAEAKTTLDEVEKYAVEVLGMQKLQDDQIEYIRMSDQDKIEVTSAEKPSLWHQIQSWLSGIFS